MNWTKSILWRQAAAHIPAFNMRDCSLYCLAAGLLLLASAVLPVQSRERPCGPDSPCTISGVHGGTYYLAFPPDWNGKERLKLLVFFHGHTGSGAAEMKNKWLVGAVTKRGYLFIAPDGPLFRFRGRQVRGWAARPEGTTPRDARDDITFVESVLADVATRVPVAPGKTIVSGYSSGGSMVWYFGCYSKIPLAGLLPVAGGLRRPLPRGGKKQAGLSTAISCPGGPQKLVHIHGFSDRQVPLEGRAIRSWHQGDVFEGLAIQRHTNQCGSRPDLITARGSLWCRTWNNCASGKPVRLCLHAGGHWMPKGGFEQQLDWLTRNNESTGQ